MKKPEKLTREIMELLFTETEDINNDLCLIIDGLCDDKQNPLPYVSDKLVQSLQEVAYRLHQQMEEINSAEAEIIVQIQDYRRERA
jgi:hypothetical protein